MRVCLSSERRRVPAIVDPVDADTEALLALEQAGWQSLCGGTAGAFYADVMTEDAVMVLAHGELMTRAEVIEALTAEPAWTSYSIDDARTVVIGRDSTALVYTGIGHRQGNADFVATMTSIYVREGEAWKLALYQQTPVRSPAG
jgi:hypothetical protein